MKAKGAILVSKHRLGATGLAHKKPRHLQGKQQKINQGWNVTPLSGDFGGRRGIL